MSYLNMIGPHNPSLFLPPSINFYDKFTGQPITTIDPDSQIYITSLFSQNGVNVTISGSKKDVEKTLYMLRDRTTELEIEDEINRLSGMSTKYNHPSTIPGKYYYTKNPHDPFNVLLNVPNSPNPYSGSGIILLERVGSDARVLLARTTRGVFEDFGGHIDSAIQPSATTLKENAIKELAEESQHLFWIQDLDLDAKINGSNRYVDILDPTNNALFRCYFICIKGLENENIMKFYNANRSIIVNKYGLGYQYTETTDISKFSLLTIDQKIKTTGATNSIQVVDISGNISTIRDRTVTCLNTLLKNKNRTILNAVCNNPIQMINKSPHSQNIIIENPILVGGPVGEVVYLF